MTKDSYQAHCNIKVSASIGGFIILVTSVMLGAVGSSNFTVLPGDFWRNPLVQTSGYMPTSILYSENTRLTPEDGVILYRDQVLRGVCGASMLEGAKVGNLLLVLLGVKHWTL